MARSGGLLAECVSQVMRKKDFYDVWFPNLSPSEPLLKAYFPANEENWKRFCRRFLAEMKQTGPGKDLDLLAALSHVVNISIGCYCQEEALCHRSLLRELLQDRGAIINNQSLKNKNVCS